MAVFNIVHLTDLHFGATANRANIFANTWRRKLGSVRQGQAAIPPTHNPQRAERLASWLYDESARLQASGDRLDAIILSGDLATTGLQNDLDPAFEYIDTPPATTYFRAAQPNQRPHSPYLATIADLALNYILVPGNHDRFKNNSCHPGEKRFDKVFAKYWQRNTRGVVGSIIAKPASVLMPGKVEHLAIIGADGCLRRSSDATSKLHEKSQGFMYPDTLAELSAKTIMAQTQQPNIAVIWVVHFPPHASGSRMETMRDSLFLQQEATRLGVNFILSGHTHRNTVYPAGPGVPIWNGGSATQFAESNGNWFQSLEVEVVNNRFVRATRQNYKWQVQNNEHDFFPFSTDHLP